MAYGGVLIQSPVPTCTEHEDEELTVLCYTCIQRICDICFKNNHVQHDWKTMAKVIREVRMNWREKETALLGILSDLQKAASNKKTEDETEKVNITEERLHSMIRDHANKLRGILRQDRQGRDVSTEVTELEKMIHFFSNEVTDSHENVIFEMEEAFLKMCQTHKTKQQKPKSSPRFMEGDISKDVIANIFGKIIEKDVDDSKDVEEEKDEKGKERDNQEDRNKVAEKAKHMKGDKPTSKDDDCRKDGQDKEKQDHRSLCKTKTTVTEIGRFTHGTDRIITIAPISTTQAWIYEYDTKQTYLVDMNGRVTDVWKRDTYMEDFIVLDNGDFIYTYFGNKKIYRALKSGKTKKLCSTPPFGPVGICRAHDGGILVCLCECDTPQITPGTRGEIHHMDLSGKIIKKYNRSEDGKTKLFTHLNRVAQNIKKDICVVDIIDKDFTSRLVVLTVEGVVRFVYKGQSTLKERFSSNDVCCDTYGRIMVTDIYNHAVHQLSPDGQFLQLLLTKQNLPRGPKSSALHGDKLWVGCKEGAVRVYQYR